MSIVAQQYNLISEQLRRGLAGYAQQKVQEGQVALGMKKMDYDIAVSEEDRAMKREEFELSKPVRQNQAMLAEAENKRLSYEMSTPITVADAVKGIDVPKEFVGEKVSKELGEHIAEITGLETKDGKFVGYGGKPMTIYDFKNNEMVNKSLAFFDWEKFLTGMKDELGTQIKNAQGADVQSTGMLDNFQQLEDKLKWIKENRGEYESRRTEVMLEHSMGVTNPKVRAAMDNMLKVQMAREAQALKNQYGTDGLYEKKYWNIKTNTEMSKWLRKGDFQQQLDWDQRMARNGFVARKQDETKDSMDQYKTEIMRIVDKYGVQALTPNQRSYHNIMLNKLSGDDLYKVMVGTEAFNLNALAEAAKDPLKMAHLVNRMVRAGELLDKKKTDNFTSWGEAEEYMTMFYPAGQGSMSKEDDAYFKKLFEKFHKKGK